MSHLINFDTYCKTIYNTNVVVLLLYNKVLKSLNYLYTLVSKKYSDMFYFY